MKKRETCARVFWVCFDVLRSPSAPNRNLAWATTVWQQIEFCLVLTFFSTPKPIWNLFSCACNGLLSPPFICVFVCVCTFPLFSGCISARHYTLLDLCKIIYQMKHTMSRRICELSKRTTNCVWKWPNGLLPIVVAFYRLGEDKRWPLYATIE